MSHAPQFKYRCETCSGTFTANRKMAVARCVSCGSMKTELLAHLVRLQADDRSPNLVSDDTFPVPMPSYPAPKIDEEFSEKAADVVGSFACIDCARKFKWNYTRTKGIDPFCATCKSSDVKSVSPRVSVIAIVRGEIPREMTKKEMKRVRFIRGQWRMRCELKEYIDALSGLMTRTGFNSAEINKARNTLNEMLANVDKQQQQRLSEYEQRVLA